MILASIPLTYTTLLAFQSLCTANPNLVKELCALILVGSAHIRPWFIDCNIPSSLATSPPFMISVTFGRRLKTNPCTAALKTHLPVHSTHQHYVQLIFIWRFRPLTRCCRFFYGRLRGDGCVRSGAWACFTFQDQMTFNNNTFIEITCYQRNRRQLLLTFISLITLKDVLVTKNIRIAWVFLIVSSLN